MILKSYQLNFIINSLVIVQIQFCINLFIQQKDSIQILTIIITFSLSNLIQEVLFYYIDYQKDISMQKSAKTSLAFLAITLIAMYFLINSNLYRMTQLDHLDDRIKFGRLEFYRKANLTLGKLQIHNRQKIFTINFDGQPVFVGEMEHFLILMQAQGQIKGNSDSFFQINDNIIKICKIQRVLSIYTDEETMTVQLQGGFQDCKDAEYKIFFRQIGQNKLNITVQAPQKYQRAYLLFNHEESNNYYGMGEQFSYLNLGHDRPYSIFTREKGVGRGQQPLTFMANLFHGAGGSYYTSYAPAPIWISSKKAAYILNSHHYMAWINNKVLVWSNNFTITYIKQKTYKSLVREIANINGYTPPIPSWVNQGAILGIQGGTQQVLNKYLKLKQQGAKITGLWLQDWVSKRQSLGYSRLWWNWQLDKDHYKNWDLLNQQLKKDNVSTLIYINPMLSDPSSKPKVKKNLYKIAQQMGYFVKLRNGEIFKTKAVSDFEASLIDFSNEEAVKFFKYLIEHALNDTNARGLMADFSEAFPAQGIAETVQQGALLHNQYPNLYLQNVNKIIEQIKGKNNDFYIFSRAGHLQSPKYTKSLWAGDQAMNFNQHTGLPSCLTAILSSGLVGYSNTHCDIGGYIHLKSNYLSFTQRSQILLLRWMQLSAFTAVFRTHQGNLPDETLQVYSNKFLARIFAFYSKVYTILKEYRRQQSEKSEEEKLPLIRAMFLELNGLQGTEKIQDQFYLGEQMIVVPFLSQDDERKYFLPKGEWRLIWDGKIFKGCDCERRWKANLPGVFIRSSSKYSERIVRQIGQQIQEYKDVVQERSSKKKEEL